MYAEFEIAALLHMPVGELRQRMSSAEFMHWLVYLSEKHRREAQASKKAQQRARRH